MQREQVLTLSVKAGYFSEYMNTKPLISVVLCTYNTGVYLAEAIDSILAQSYNNFELIIWDDGSTDDTRSIVGAYNDKRIRYYFHENTGLGMALRLACEKANGEYIARMDSDDISLPNRFEKEIAFLEANFDYVLVSSAVIYIDEKGVEIGRSFPYTDSSIITATRSMTVHPMAMMRRESYVKAGGYLPIRFMEDDLFWSKLSKQGKFYNITEPLGKYRLLQSSLGHNRSKYDSVLKEFRNKMAKDDVVLDSDIELYNNLYLYSKQFKETIQDKQMSRKKVTSEERVFEIICRVIGDRGAEKVICGLKNFRFKMK